MFTIVFYVTEAAISELQRHNSLPPALAHVLQELDVVPLEGEPAAFTVTVDHLQQGEQVVTQLQASSYVEAAYLKPPDAAP